MKNPDTAPPTPEPRLVCPTCGFVMRNRGWIASCNHNCCGKEAPTDFCVPYIGPVGPGAHDLNWWRLGEASLAVRRMPPEQATQAVHRLSSGGAEATPLASPNNVRDRERFDHPWAAPATEMPTSRRYPAYMRRFVFVVGVACILLGALIDHVVIRPLVEAIT